LGNILEGDPEKWDQMLNLNINATCRAVKAVLPSLVKQKLGDMILTGLVAGVIPVV